MTSLLSFFFLSRHPYSLFSASFGVVIYHLIYRWSNRITCVFTFHLAPRRKRPKRDEYMYSYGTKKEVLYNKITKGRHICTSQSGNTEYYYLGFLLCSCFFRFSFSSLRLQDNRCSHHLSLRFDYLRFPFPSFFLFLFVCLFSSSSFPLHNPPRGKNGREPGCVSPKAADTSF